MRIAEILSFERIRCDVEASSRKRALETVSELLAQNLPGVQPRAVFDALLARERLGSTGFGQGVALPHGRVSALQETLGAFIRVENGVDFDAVDNRPVDLIFAMLVPEASTDEHLEILSELARQFSDETIRARLRECTSASAVFAVLTHQEAPPSAHAG